MINVIVKRDAIELPAGAVVRVPGTWHDYQAMLEHLGDRISLNPPLIAIVLAVDHLQLPQR